MRYNVLVNDIERKGFNAGIYDSAIPFAAHVQRAETEDAQVEGLLKKEKQSLHQGNVTSANLASEMQS